MRRRSVMQAAVAVVSVMGTLAFSAVAQANVYGQRHISTNTVLADHQFGAIIFDADNISLDCAGKQVHISSYTRLNCSPQGTAGKCGIIAAGRTNVTIKNCQIVGGFDYGLDVESSTGVHVMNTSAAGPTVGFEFSNNTSTQVDNVAANTTGTGLIIEHDNYGNYNNAAVDMSLHDGIDVSYGNLTSLVNPSVTNSGQSTSGGTGLYSFHNYALTVDYLYSANNVTGFVDIASNIATITHGIMTGNFYEGLSFGEDSYMSIGWNQAYDNDTGGFGCDAYQRGASNNDWYQNTLESWCGTVPDPH